MHSNNEVIIAAAGGGKTTRIVDRVLTALSRRTAVLTFTQVNTEEIAKRFYERNGALPPNAEVWSWFSFLLREMARPYQSSLHPQRIDGMIWCNARSVPYIPKSKPSQFYFSERRLIYSDKLSQFIVDCNTATSGLVIQRLEQRFDQIFVDEVQDLAGYDLDILELLLDSHIQITMVGDHRQATYSTNNSAKHKQFRGAGIIKKFQEWEKRKLVALRFEGETYRCHPLIAAFADTLFPSIESTKSLNTATSGHDGIFLISSREADEYIGYFKPQILRYDKRTRCEKHELTARNFGECKGLTFDHVLIYPNQAAAKWLISGNLGHIEGSLEKMYVAITRARYSVAFVLDKASALENISRFQIAGLAQ